MLEQLLQNLHNWFRVRDSVNGKHYGSYTVENGSITLPFLQFGQYFRIVGSVLNDGLYIYGDGIIHDGDGKEVELRDETFTGSIWALAVPRAILELAIEIGEWCEKYDSVMSSPYTSESFGGYSYTKAGSGGGENSVGINGWPDAFRTRLSPWRKIRED